MQFLSPAATLRDIFCISMKKGVIKMSVLKSILAFVLSIAVILFCYYHVSIPILPCVAIYIFMPFVDNRTGRFHSVLVWLAALAGAYLYGANAVLSIIHYPQYLTVFGICAEFLTAFAFIGAAIINASAARYNK